MRAIPVASLIGPVALAAVIGLLAHLTAGCAPKTELTFSSPQDDAAGTVPVKLEKGYWYQPDEQTIRLVLVHEYLRHSGQIILDGVETDELVLVVDLPAGRTTTREASTPVDTDSLSGYDLTDSGLVYISGREGAVTWGYHPEDEQLESPRLVGSIQATCRVFPPRYYAEHRLANDYVLAGRFTAEYDPEAAQKASKRVIWSLRRER
ncbi:MAG TPA: hypothetical protein VMZ31_09480 [Phycisphaerae bacterium]|nr:hypothetical protein [Phycisphaerae bacterium]